MTAPPTANQVLSDAAVIDGIRRAWLESNVGQTDAVEQGGFIVRDGVDGSLAVIRLPASARDSLSYTICPDGTFKCRQIVGSFHTHPTSHILGIDELHET